MSDNYYDLLEVEKSATPKQIKTAYRERIKENHPDQFKGLRAKYEPTDDKVLLSIIEEKITQAEEKTKLLNQAYAVLSSSVSRKKYDEQQSTVADPDIPPTADPDIPPADVVVNTTKISFGKLFGDEKISRTFIIDNLSEGPVDKIHIDWEDTPDWAEIIIEPNPENTFPITVHIKVKT